MGLSPRTHYGTYTGNEFSRKSGIFENWVVSFRWDVETDCTNLNQGKWSAKLRLMVKVSGNRTVDHIEIPIGNASLYSSHPIGSSSGGFSPNGQWTEAYFEAIGTLPTGDSVVSGTYYKDHSESTYAKNAKKTAGNTQTHVSIYFTNIGLPVQGTIPSYEYGGIDYSSISTKSDLMISSTDKTLTVTYQYSAPYDMVTQIFVKNTNGQIVGSYEHNDDYNMAVTSHTFSGLTADTQYFVYVYVTCENGKQLTTSRSGRTKYTVVTSITLPNGATEVYVNENEEITVTPVVAPNDATNKRLAFSKSETDQYTINGGSSYTGTSAVLKGVFSSVSPYTIVVNAVAGDATSTFNVYVCRPATGVSSSITNKKLSPDETYKIEPVVFPSDSTDSQVTYAVTSALDKDGNTATPSSVATVTSDGLVTAVGEGTAVITLTLARRGISSTGTIINKDSVEGYFYLTVTNECSFEYLDAEVGYITSEYIDTVYGDLVFLREALNLYGERTPWEDVVSVDSFSTPQTSGYSTPVYEVATCLNTLEDCVDKIYTGTRGYAGKDPSDMEAADDIYDTSHTWEGLIDDAVLYTERWADYTETVLFLLIDEGVVKDYYGVLYIDYNWRKPTGGNT